MSANCGRCLGKSGMDRCTEALRLAGFRAGRSFGFTKSQVPRQEPNGRCRATRLRDGLAETAAAAGFGSAGGVLWCRPFRQAIRGGSGSTTQGPELVEGLSACVWRREFHRATGNSSLSDQIRPKMKNRQITNGASRFGTKPVGRDAGGGGLGSPALHPSIPILLLGPRYPFTSEKSEFIRANPTNSEIA